MELPFAEEYVLYSPVGLQGIYHYWKYVFIYLIWKANGEPPREGVVDMTQPKRCPQGALSKLSPGQVTRCIFLM